MTRCNAQWIGLVQPPRHVILSGALFPVALAVVLASCVSRAPLQVEDVGLGVIAANPEEYDGKFVRAEACVSVMIEGMYLLECGTRYPIFAFEAGESDRSKEVFTELVALGHSLMGESPEEIRIELQGIYRNSKGKSRFDHIFELSGFRKIKVEK